MRLGVVGIAGLSLASQNIDQVKVVFEVLETQLSKVIEEGTKQATLYETQACTYKDASDAMKQAIEDNNGKYEGFEGDRQNDESRRSVLKDAKENDASIAHSQDQLNINKMNLKDTRKQRKEANAARIKKEEEAMEGKRLIDVAVEALNTARAQTVELKNAAFIQLQEKMAPLMSLTQLLSKYDPERHESKVAGVIGMLNKMKEEVDAHLTDVRKTWEKDSSDFDKKIQEFETNIATHTENLEKRTTELEEKNASIKKLTLDMSNLRLVIKTDQKALKEATAAAKKTKDEFDADQETRGREIGAIKSCLAKMTEEFKTSPVQPTPVESKDGGPADLKCNYDYDTVSLFTQLKKSQTKRSLLQKAKKFSVADDVRDALLQFVNAKASTLHSDILMTVARSVRGDPLKQIRTMIQNLITRLQKEGEEEQARHEECSTAETALQTERASQKKNINEYTSALANAQSLIAKARAAIKSLNESINETKKNCNASYSQLKYDHALQLVDKETADHGVQGLNKALEALNGFFGDTAQASEEAGYTGDIQGASAIIGLITNLRDEFQHASNEANNNMANVQDEINNLTTDTKDTIQAKRAEESTTVEVELNPGIESFNLQGTNLKNEVRDYSLTTTDLMNHKYKGKCAAKQLSKEEQLENKKAEIVSLKEALEILENHGKGTFAF